LKWVFPCFLVALVMSALLPAAPAAAETKVTVEGNVIAIAMTVDVVGAKGKLSPDRTTSLIDSWNKVLNDTWGAAFGQLPYKNCFKLELKLKLTARGDDFDSSKGRHRIVIGAPTSGLTFDGTGFEGAPETTRNTKTDDGTRSFENDRDGAIPEDAPPTVIAHEFGHLMGLGDDRKNGKPKNGRDGTMMVGGVAGVDTNVVQKIDQNLVERIGNAIEKHLDNQGKKLPKCEEWTGKLTSRHSVPLAACTFTWSGTFDVGVVEDDLIGSGTVSPDGRCPAQGGPVTITGTADNDGFTLGSNSYVFPAGTRIEKTAPDRAEGTSAYHDAYNDVMTTFEMKCRKNCGEAVG